MVDLATKKRLKILVHIALKNWATAIRFIIAIAYPNSLAEAFEPLLLSYILVKIKTKKLWRSEGFNVIYTVDIFSVIINALMKKLFFAHWAKKWEEREATICTWCSKLKQQDLNIF